MQKGEAKTRGQLEKIDLLLRFLVNNLTCTLSQYIESPYSVILEKIVVDHHQTCQDYPTCFCKKYQDEEISRVDFIGDSIRKQYLEYYVRNTYLEECKLIKDQTSDFLFSYYAFMINWTRNQTVSFREILLLREKVIKKATVRQKMLLKYVFDLASTSFELEAQRLQQKKRGQLIDIVQFDESLEDASLSYRQCLKEKQELLIIMSKEDINLMQLEQQALKLHERRTHLQEDLTRLFKINSTSLSLLSLCEGFEDCLTIEPTFRKMFMDQIKTGQRKNTIPFYYDDSVAIYISLLSEIGKIVKVSKNFSEVVPLVKTNSDAIGKNINFIMNDEIANVHDAILINCVSKKLLNQDVKHYPLVLGKNTQGWAVVYSFKVQLCMLGNKELGACGWLKQVIDGNIYIMTSSVLDNYRFFLQDEKFFNILFKGYFTQSDTKKIRFGNLMPIMKHLAKKGTPGSVYETILIKPTNLKDAMTERDIYDSNFIQDLYHLNLFSIRFSYYAINGQFVQFVEFQILNLRPIIDLHSKKEALKNLRMQIQEYSDAEVIKKKLVDQQNKMQEIKEATKDNFGSLDSQIFERNSLSIIFEDDPIKQIKKTLEVYKGRKQSLILHPNQKFNQNDLENQPLSARKLRIPIEDRVFYNTPDQFQQDTPRENQSTIDFSIQKRGNEEESIQDEVKKVKQLQNQNTAGQNQQVYNSKSDQMIINQMSFSGGNGITQFLQPQNNVQDSSLRFQNGVNNINEKKLYVNNSLNDGQNIISTQENNHYQNILSQDSAYLSPASSQRKALLFFPDTQRQNHTEGVMQDTAIQENSQEEDLDYAHSKVNQSGENRPRQSSFKNNNYSSNRKKNVSISGTLKVAQKSNINSQQLIINSDEALPNQENQIDDLISSQSANQVDDEYENANKLKEDRESSVKSGKSNRSSIRQHMISTIRSKKFSSGLRAVNMMGIVSIIVIFGLNIISFFIQYNDLLNQQSNFEKIFWVYQQKKYLSLVFSDQGLYYSWQLGQLSYVKEDEQAILVDTIKANNVYIYNAYKSYIMMATENTQKPVFVFQLIDKYKLQNLILNSIDTTKQEVMQFNLYYELLYLLNFIYPIMYLYDKDGFAVNSVYNNYQYIFISLEDVYKQNLTNFDDQITQTKLLLTVQLVLISVVSVLFSIMIVPVHIFSQKKREEILRLFSTISPDKLIFMMQTVSKYLEQQERIELDKQRNQSIRIDKSYILTKQFATNQNYKINQSARSSVFAKQNGGLQKAIENMKKKSISSTNSITKFSFKMFFGLLIGLTSMQFYGVSKFIIGNNSIQYFQTQINFLASFDYFFDELAGLISVRFNFPSTLYAGNQTQKQLDLYKSIAINYQSRAKSRLNNLMDEFKNIENYSGSQQSTFSSFLFPMFKENICEVMFNAPSDYIKDIRIDKNTCLTINGGVYQKGLFVAAQKFITMFDSYIEGIFDNFDVQVLQTNIKNMYKSISLIDEYNFSFMLMFIAKSIHNFYQDVYAVDFNNSVMISILLLVVQLIILLIVLVFGWRIYYNKIGKQYFLTKQLLDLIDLNILLDSPYVISFFKRNS